jgi:hypothetical protein
MGHEVMFRWLHVHVPEILIFFLTPNIEVVELLFRELGQDLAGKISAIAQSRNKLFQGL